MLPSSEECAEGTRTLTRVWACAPRLLAAQQPYRDHLRDGSVLPRRDQELAVLRIGYRCGSPYEFGQHTRIAKKVGVSDAEILSTTAAVGSHTGDTGLLMRVTDELYDFGTIQEETWRELTDRFTDEQIIELISVIGRYWTISVLANALHLPLEPDNPGFPDSRSESSR